MMVADQPISQQFKRRRTRDKLNEALESLLVLLRLFQLDLQG